MEKDETTTWQMSANVAFDVRTGWTRLYSTTGGEVQFVCECHWKLGVFGI